jgi:hypothetical protein
LYTFTFTGADQSLIIPGGVDSVFVELWGAGGGWGYPNAASSGGSGGYVSGYLNTAIEKNLKIVVGKGGMRGSSNQFSASDGGGLAGIFKNSVSFSNALVIAGGGGGAGASQSSEAGGGGGGGGTTALNAQDDIRIGTLTGGRGGSQSAGGAKGVDAYGAGTQLAGGQLQGGEGSGASVGGPNTQSRVVWNTQQYGFGGLGGLAPSGNYTGGGGGAGYYGGGGGANGYAGGGGGGSSYVDLLSSSTNLQGSRGGSNTNPPGTGSLYYVSGVGVGSFSGSGGNALVVIRWD